MLEQNDRVRWSKNYLERPLDNNFSQLYFARITFIYIRTK